MSRWHVMLCAAFLMCAVVLGARPGAFAGPDADLGVDAEIQTLDKIKSQLERWSKKTDAAMENNLQDPNYTALQDLVYFSHMAYLEIHFFIDLYVLSRSPGTGKTFRDDKVGELRTKGGYVLFDLRKRLKYVEEDLSPVDPDVVAPYRKEIVGRMREAISVLAGILGQLDKGADGSSS